MFSALKMDITQVLRTVKTDKRVWALLSILAVGTYLRLWHIQHLFKWIYDYDEGAYSLGGRFISQGYLPYRDFPLVHPPLYDLVLAAIYKIFGYNFFYGRYLSVVLFLGCVLLVYLVVKRLYHSGAGLVAAALLAVFPGFFLLWYRAVQEPLGIFLILLALYLAADYIKASRHGGYLAFSGLCLGLALATKYTFAPAVIGIGGGIVLLRLTERRETWRQIPARLVSREIGWLVAGTAAGFILVAGLFFIVAPRQFFDQTLMSQIGYRVAGSLESTVRRFRLMPAGTTTDTVNLLTLGFTLAVPILMLLTLAIRRRFSRTNVFLLAALVSSVPLCALFDPFGEVRYFTSAFVFTLPAVAAVTPQLDTRLLAARLTPRLAARSSGVAVSVLTIMVSVLGTLVLLRQYNFMGPDRVTYEEQAYAETLQYLDTAGARKIYSLDPIVAALSPTLSSSLYFDTFGLLFVLRETPEAVIDHQITEGVEYFTTDPFQLLGLRNREVAELLREITERGILVKQIVPGEADAGLPMLGIQIFTAPR